jgi:hypothetical protein
MIFWLWHCPFGCDTVPDDAFWIVTLSFWLWHCPRWCLLDCDTVPVWLWHCPRWCIFDCDTVLLVVTQSQMMLFWLWHCPCLVVTLSQIMPFWLWHCPFGCDTVPDDAVMTHDTVNDALWWSSCSREIDAISALLRLNILICNVLQRALEETHADTVTFSITWGSDWGTEPKTSVVTCFQVEYSFFSLEPMNPSRCSKLGHGDVVTPRVSHLRQQKITRIEQFTYHIHVHGQLDARAKPPASGDGLSNNKRSHPRSVDMV